MGNKLTSECIYNCEKGHTINLDKILLDIVNPKYATAIYIIFIIASKIMTRFSPPIITIINMPEVDFTTAYFKILKEEVNIQVPGVQSNNILYLTRMHINYLIEKYTLPIVY